MPVTIGGITLSLAMFRGTGHTENEPATTAGGHTYESEPLWPDRAFNAMLNEMSDAKEDLANNRTTTSSSSVTIGSGAKTFMLAVDLPVFAGVRGQAVDSENSANTLDFTITSYDSVTKTAVVNVYALSGSGTISSWNIIFGVGPRGTVGSLDNLVEDLTPELGGDLDGGGFNISDVTLQSVDDAITIYFDEFPGGEKDYVVWPILPFDIIVTNLAAHTTSGMFQANMKFDGVDVSGEVVGGASGGSDVSFSASDASKGQSVELAISDLSSPVGASVTIFYRRNIVVNT